MLYIILGRYTRYMVINSVFTYFVSQQYAIDVLWWRCRPPYERGSCINHTSLYVFRSCRRNCNEKKNTRIGCLTRIRKYKVRISIRRVHLPSSLVWTTMELDGWPSTVLKNGTKKKSYLLYLRRLANV